MNTITISIREYQSLQDAAGEYRALKTSLLNAGTSIESIQILINAGCEIPTPPLDENAASDREVTSIDSQSLNEDARSKIVRNSFSSKRCSTQASKSVWSTRGYNPPTPPNIFEESGCYNTSHEEVYDDQLSYVPPCKEDRSVVLKGLPRNTTLTDVAKAIKGGAVLNFYIKRRENSAHVAFVEPRAAENFIFHVRKHGLYVKGKKIHVAWDHLQRVLDGGIARRIFSDGATRNLIIRFPKSEVTEKVIRDDLEHIHLLEVVSVDFKDGHAWISLNGVSQAVSARGCMMSRWRYKGSRIEFWQDPCAEALITPAKPVSPYQQVSPKHKASAASQNRFNALSVYNEIP